MAGPIRKATAAGVMTTRSAMPSRSAGPETTGPVATAITGTTPEQAAMAAADPPQPCRASMPSDTSAPLEASSSTKGIRSCSAYGQLPLRFHRHACRAPPPPVRCGTGEHRIRCPSNCPKVQLDRTVDPGTYRGHVALAAAPSRLIL